MHTSLKLAEDKEAVVPEQSTNQVIVSAKRKKRQRTIAGDGFSDIQFESPPTKVPYKTILFAIGLIVVGSILVVIGSLFFTGVIYMKNSDHTWPVILIGALMFIPGVYYVRIAYYAYKGYDGFSYENMPEFD